MFPEVEILTFYFSNMQYGTLTKICSAGHCTAGDYNLNSDITEKKLQSMGFSKALDELGLPEQSISGLY